MLITTGGLEFYADELSAGFFVIPTTVPLKAERSGGIS